MSGSGWIRTSDAPLGVHVYSVVTSATRTTDPNYRLGLGFGYGLLNEGRQLSNSPPRHVCVLDRGWAEVDEVFMINY